MKDKAIIYYQENKVPIRMEAILNSMFFDKPKDVYGHLVRIITIIFKFI